MENKTTEHYLLIGASGCGKTHTVDGILKMLLKENPDKAVVRRPFGTVGTYTNSILIFDDEDYDTNYILEWIISARHFGIDTITTRHLLLDYKLLSHIDYLVVFPKTSPRDYNEHTLKRFFRNLKGYDPKTVDKTIDQLLRIDERFVMVSRDIFI